MSGITFQPEARLLTVQPYDKSSIKNIERAILEEEPPRPSAVNPVSGAG